MTSLRRKYFIMTVDVDGWASLLNFYNVKNDPDISDSQVDEECGVSRLLDLFGDNEIFATFFVPGEIARRHPEMVKEIHREGHEVACHGLMHLKDECLLERFEQEKTIEQATHIIERITGARPLGFRAPCLRANMNTLRILYNRGYLYDSSMISTFIPGYYGDFAARSDLHWISLDTPAGKNEKALLEIPVSVNPILHIPLSAAWMRNFGTAWTKFGVRMSLYQHNVAVLYVHPRDVLQLPRIEKIPWHVYRNTGSSTLRALDAVIQQAKSLGASFSRAVDVARGFCD